jgi:major inositol transporter-like SP family MFS transporter
LLAIVYSSLSGLLSGYQMGISGGALNSLQSSSLEITSSQVGHIASIYFLGLMVAGPFGGFAIDKFGRRTCILYMDGMLVFGGFLLVVAPNYNTILAGRFIVGCATAVSLVAAVSYLTELASVNHHHSHHRGALVLSVQASIALGFLVSYLLSYASYTASSDNNEGGVWRLLFGVSTGFIACVQWMGMRRMPESPQWLVTKGHFERAHVAVLQFIPHHDTSSTDLESLAYSDVIRANMNTSPIVLSQFWRQAVM